METEQTATKTRFLIPETDDDFAREFRETRAQLGREMDERLKQAKEETLETPEPSPQEGRIY